MKKPYRRRHPVRFGKKINKAKEESIIKFNKEWLAEREEGSGRREKEWEKSNSLRVRVLFECASFGIWWVGVRLVKRCNNMCDGFVKIKRRQNETRQQRDLRVGARHKSNERVSPQSSSSSSSFFLCLFRILFLVV